MAFDLYSQNRINKDEIIVLLWNSVLNMYGEIEASKLNLWLIEINQEDTNKDNHYYGILKCTRGFENKLITALSSVSRYKNSRVVIHTRGTSGTIKSLKEKYNI